MILDQGKKFDDHLQRMIDADRELPPYRAELDSEITVNRTVGLHAKGVPPWALGLTLLILAIAAAIVLVMRVR